MQVTPVDWLIEFLSGLSRLPLVADVVRIPPSGYGLGWSCEKASAHDPIPIELLQEQAILKEFVSRVCRYGWTSRRQFEETWMAFLSVLSSVPLDEESETDEAQHEQTVTDRIAAGRVALRCITALLLESVLASRPGNPLRRRGVVNNVRSPHRHLDDFSTAINTRKTVAAPVSFIGTFVCSIDCLIDLVPYFFTLLRFLGVFVGSLGDSFYMSSTSCVLLSLHAFWRSGSTLLSLDHERLAGTVDRRCSGHQRQSSGFTKLLEVRHGFIQSLDVGWAFEEVIAVHLGRSREIGWSPVFELYFPYFSILSLHDVPSMMFLLWCFTFIDSSL